MRPLNVLTVDGATFLRVVCPEGSRVHLAHGPELALPGIGEHRPGYWRARGLRKGRSTAPTSRRMTRAPARRSAGPLTRFAIASGRAWRPRSTSGISVRTRSAGVESQSFRSRARLPDPLARLPRARLAGRLHGPARRNRQGGAGSAWTAACQDFYAVRIVSRLARRTGFETRRIEST